MEELVKGLPWWIKWVAIPVIALVVFGGLIFLVKKFTSGSSSSSHRDW
jgi:hypothetical protein